MSPMWHLLRVWSDHRSVLYFWMVLSLHAIHALMHSKDKVFPFQWSLVKEKQVFSLESMCLTKREEEGPHVRSAVRTERRRSRRTCLVLWKASRRNWSEVRRSEERKSKRCTTMRDSRARQQLPRRGTDGGVVVAVVAGHNGVWPHMTKKIEKEKPTHSQS